MVDVLLIYYGEDRDGEPHRDLGRLSIDYQSIPPIKRQKHSKSLNVYKLFKDLGHPIPIEFDIREGVHFMLLLRTLSILFGTLGTLYNNISHQTTSLGKVC